MTKNVCWDFYLSEKVFRIVAKSEVWKFFVGVWIWEWERMTEWRIRILFLLHKLLLSVEVTGLGPTSSSCQPALYGQYQRLIHILYIMATRWLIACDPNIILKMKLSYFLCLLNIYLSDGLRISCGTRGAGTNIIFPDTDLRELRCVCSDPNSGDIQGKYC